MPLGTEVNLGPGHVVLDGGRSYPLKRYSPPVFGLCLLWPNGWMVKTPRGTEVDLGPGRIVLDGDSAPPCERGTAAPLFSAHVYCATVARLSYC